MMQSHRYAHARLGFRQFYRWLALEMKREDETLTMQEALAHKDLSEALSIQEDDYSYGQVSVSFARGLLGCRTELPRWLGDFLPQVEAIETAPKTYHNAAVGVLISYLSIVKDPEDWRRQFYPIYVADTEFHGKSTPTPEGFDVWLIKRVHVTRYASKLWPWNPQELIA